MERRYSDVAIALLQYESYMQLCRLQSHEEVEALYMTEDRQKKVMTDDTEG